MCLTYNTDHYLACAKVKFDWKFRKNIKRSDSSLKHVDKGNFAPVGEVLVVVQLMTTILRQFWRRLVG